MKKYTVLLLCLPLSAFARDLGVWGDVYPVAEQSLLSMIHQRLDDMQSTGQLAEMQQQFKDRVIENTLRPPPVEGLKTDTQSHTHWVDPSITVAQEMADQQGRVFARKGDVINPLDTVPLATTLYFLDADDARQVAWMREQKPSTVSYKVILVGGNIRDATTALNTRIYFDQGSALTQKLRLNYVPAVVTQDGRRLKVVSAAIEEGGAQ
ncbi:type-F conjugative transfer system protein TraW (plasmid) [Edwardsiella tarda]|uniref:type-F conjugative transfer system protein TraW n=1 Tax=Edwardsiella tarda TaxID=636 RepID=UPI000D50A916|nr:type-F conjugative transfer system protein TraW [Edwardsiella tarda]UCQ29567.1 type-F conjugative transfer system protein TraW [Edwardsiella tarda]